jgi:ComF family protein
MIQRLLRLIFPPKCLFCQKVLLNTETDLCHDCRSNIEDFPRAKIKFSFVAGWTALWYYKGDPRISILRYKFRDVRNYAPRYGRLLGMHLLQADLPPCDVLTWVPVSASRKFTRGYDQVELVAKRVGKELKQPVVRTLRKVRNAPPQSSIRGEAARKANVLGAFKVSRKADIRGKRILLLDDVITTGATVSECARVLLTAGAKEVYCAALAATRDKKTNSR